MACGSNCPCKCVRTKKRRTNKRLAPRHNPVYDLLSFLVAEKYKEPINKPTIIKPESISTGTSTERIKTAEAGTETAVAETAEAGTFTEPTATRSMETQVEQLLEKIEPVAVHEGVQRKKEPIETDLYTTKEANKYNKEVAIESAKRRATDLENRGLPPEVRERRIYIKKNKAEKPAVAEGGGGGLPPSQTTRKVGLVRPVQGSPLGNVVATLQAQTDQEAGSVGNVDFQ
jgi:hypothetical protein